MRIIIVGAGIVGVATALELARRGHDVVIFDGQGIAKGASFGNAGLIATSAVVPVPVPGLWRDVPKYLLKKDSPLQVSLPFVMKNASWFMNYLAAGRESQVGSLIDNLHELLHDSVQAHKFLARGTTAARFIRDVNYLYAYESHEQIVEDKFTWAQKRVRDIQFKVLDRRQLEKVEPDIGDSFQAGVLVGNHAMILDPGNYAKALMEEACRLGATFIEANVSHIVPSSKRVYADEVEMKYDRLILTSGARTPELLAPFGIHLPILNERGYHVEFTEPSMTHRHPIMIARGKCVATPMEGRLRLAGLVEYAPMDAPLNAKLVQKLKDEAAALFPRASLRHSKTWVGNRPSTPDSLPIIDEVKGLEDVFVGAGHQHIGLTASAKTGRILADMSLGMQNHEHSAYSIDRF